MSVPILLCKFHTPEMRAGREKLHPDSRTLIRSVSHIDDAAFLLFFGSRVFENKLGPEIEFFLQIKQTTVRVDHDGLAVFSKFAARVALTFGLDWNARKHPRTAPFAAGLYFGRRMQLSWIVTRFESTIQAGHVSKSTVQKSRVFASQFP